MMNWRIIILTNLMLIVKLCSGEFDVNLYNQFDSGISIPVLEKEWNKGNIDAGSELAFSRVLGLGSELDLGRGISDLESLVSLGSARAFTTLGLLLNHNLTGEFLSYDERKSKARSTYLTAAIEGDPLSQMIVAEHYFEMGDCESAVNYFHKSSSYVIQTIPEMELSRPTYVRHVWDEDNEILIDAFPSQDKVDFYEYLANNGDIEAALNTVALLIADSKFTEKNYEKAEYYLQMAVKRNNTIAMVWLAQMYLKGAMNGSDTEALELLQTALAYGNNLAHSGLGRIYMEGRAGFDKDYKKAEYHFQKGIAAGNIDSYYHLGKLYNLKEGSGSPQEAAELWTVPASYGHVHSAWALAEYYRENFLKSTYKTVLSPSSTELSAKICEMVVSFYRVVSQSGMWGNLFEEAYEDYSSGKKEAALMKYFLLSDLGYKAAHINAARILDEGENELYNEKEPVAIRAFEMWGKAAANGAVKGYVRLGDYFYYGTDSITKDLKKAYEHYLMASRNGEGQGSFSLALLTEWGEGIPQNITRAEEIYDELWSKNPEAEVPVALALMRLKVFLLIKKIFYINLYSWNWTIENFLNVSSQFYSSIMQLDAFIICFLLSIIAINLYLRRQN